MVKKTYRQIIYILIALISVIVIGSIAANIILKNKVEKLLKEAFPKNTVLSYSDIDVKTLAQTVVVKNASLIIQNQEDAVGHTFINAKNLIITDIGIRDYLFNNEIHIGTISFVNPVVAHYKDNLKSVEDDSLRGTVPVKKSIIINHFLLKNTEFAIYESGPDSTRLFTKGLNLKLHGIKINDSTVSDKIPFEFKSFEAHTDTLFAKASPYENLTVGSVSIKKRSAYFKKLQLKTKYSKRELSRIISVERDHYNLSLDSLLIEEIDFGFNQGIFFAKSKLVSLQNPSLEIYRDKLVADDPKIKPLYSKMLRDLPFELTVDSLKIANAKIKYQERVKPENMGGSINFEKLQAAISNVGNTYKSPTKTVIKVKSLFMDKTPFMANWSFDVQNKNDHFTFQAEVGTLVADKMNSFTEPNLKVQLKGEANKSYFTIDGNNDHSKTDMKLSYSDFKVTLLKKNSREKNKIFSAIANIFISKSSEKEGEFYREGSATASRDKTKSVFNFLWISVKSVLEAIML